MKSVHGYQSLDRETLEYYKYERVEIARTSEFTKKAWGGYLV